MNRSRHIVARALLVVGLIFGLGFWTVQAPPTASGAADCSTFGRGAVVKVNGVDLSGRVQPLFEKACQRFPSRIDRKNGDTYWWRGLVVQDYFGTSGNENGAIFYDANAWQGGDSAYVLWGPILTELRKPSNTWGPPIGDVTEAWQSPPRDGGKGERTTGSLVRFHNLDAYYNGHKKSVYVVSDVAKNMFDALGGTGGFMGFPEADGAWAQASGFSGAQGFFQPFEGGILQTWNQGGHWVSFAVHGAIQAVYNTPVVKDGPFGSGGKLGFPVSNEILIPDVPTGASGILQEFEGGGVVYDGGIVVNKYFPVDPKTQKRLTGDGGGVSYVILNPVYTKIRPLLFQTTGFPISSMLKTTDKAYFEYGWADQNGFHVYDSQTPYPPPPDLLILPYDHKTTVMWSGGPHRYNNLNTGAIVATNSGSGMDFSAGWGFPVRALAAGTVELVDSGDFGERVVIRSQMNGTAILYGHLKPGSRVIYRPPNGQFSVADGAKCLSYTESQLSSGPKNNCYILTRGTFVHEGEVFAIEGSSSAQFVHLHVELMSGIYDPNSSPYLDSALKQFGPAVSWNNILIGSRSGPQYRIYPIKADTGDYNYDGSAVLLVAGQDPRPCPLSFADLLRYENHHPVFETRSALMQVAPSYRCDLGEATNAIGNPFTVFPDGSLLTNLQAGEIVNAGVDGATLVSTDPNTEVTFDPTTTTLDSPFLGLATSPTIYLPALTKNLAPAGTSPVFPTPTPEPSPTPTPTPPTPGSVILSAPDFNNGGFETGTMEGWAMPNGTIDVDGSFVHSGAYSVHGTSASGAVSFYRDYPMLAYQFWSDAGRLQTTTTGWFQNGDSEDYRVLVHYIGTSGTDLATFDSGWKHDSGSIYVQMTDANRAVPAGTTVIRLEVQIRRNSGGYTDVDVDDLTVQLNFIGP